MFYSYNNVTGRITRSANIQTPLFPITPRNQNKAIAPPKVMYDASVKLSSVSQAMQQSSQSKTIPGSNSKYAPLNENLKKKMDLFQKSNDVPVFLKGGAADVILYRLTVGLCFVGLGMSYAWYSTRLYKKG